MVSWMAAILATYVIAEIVWRLRAEGRAERIRTARLAAEGRSVVLALIVIVLTIGPRFIRTGAALLVGALVFLYFVLELIPERTWSHWDATD